MKKLAFYCLLSFIFFLDFDINAQNITRRETVAVRTEGGVKIDGILDETEWQRAPIAEGIYTQKEPKAGKPASFRTDTRILYSDGYIYVGAQMHDPYPDSIKREMTQRDNIGNDDVFAVFFDTYRDGNNGFGFFVTAAGVQADAKYYAGNDGEDFSWSAVWNVAVKMNEKGWSAEFAIPYSALRFPDKPVQEWRVNFGRHVRRYRETSFWNEVKNELTGFINQAGELQGIKDIKSPFRLQATPFVAAYAQNNFDKNSSPKSAWGRSLTAGMDVRYGLSDAFTLDMTLIPDFGQVRSDNKVLNLSPYEIQFDEQRQFFTEGVELFNKGNFFYSRRIGEIPNSLVQNLSNKLGQGEYIGNRPAQAQLYNASKVSGRMKNGLGIGVFNAVSAPTYAKINNDSTEGVRTEMLSPLTNYSVVSFDQNLPNNSFVTLVNTNVMRSGSTYDANLTGVNFNLKNKANSYSIGGLGSVANRIDASTETSGKYSIFLEKISGRWQGGLWQNFESWNYNPNDLGFLRSPNENTFGFWGGHYNFKPKKYFNRYNIEMEGNYSLLHKPRGKFQGASLELRAFFFTKKFFAFGFFSEANPIGTHDYFEPRKFDFQTYFAQVGNVLAGGFISTNYANPFAIDVNIAHRRFFDGLQVGTDFSVVPRYRVSDKLSFVWTFSSEQRDGYVNFVGKNSNSVGYAATGNATIFGRRNQQTITNTPSVTWTHSNKAGLTFRVRHYWTKVVYPEFLALNTEDGKLIQTSYKGYDANNNKLHDVNFNIFNIDAVYTWRFAPGSDLIINWKNEIFGQDSKNLNLSYFQNLQGLTDFPQTNSFSVKLIYFVDYLSFQKKK